MKIVNIKNLSIQFDSKDSDQVNNDRINIIIDRVNKILNENDDSFESPSIVRQLDTDYNIINI